MTEPATAVSAGARVAEAMVEKRAAERYACMSDCLVRVEGAPEPFDFPGMVYNISATGVGLALPFLAPAGTVLVVEAAGCRRSGPRLRARVVRTVLQQFVWFHGCEFLSSLGAEELRHWRAAFRAD